MDCLFSCCLTYLNTPPWSINDKSIFHSNCPLNSPTANVTIFATVIYKPLYPTVRRKKVPKHSNRKSRTQTEERLSPTSVPILHWTMNIDSGPWLTQAWPTSYGILRTPTLTTASILSWDIVTRNQLILVIFFIFVIMFVIAYLQYPKSRFR